MWPLSSFSDQISRAPQFTSQPVMYKIWDLVIESELHGGGCWETRWCLNRVPRTCTDEHEVDPAVTWSFPWGANNFQNAVCQRN